MNRKDVYTNNRGGIKSSPTTVIQIRPKPRRYPSRIETLFYNKNSSVTIRSLPNDYTTLQLCESRKSVCLYQTPLSSGDRSEETCVR